MMSDDRFAGYRRGLVSGTLKSATPNAVREMLDEIERLRGGIVAVENLIAASYGVSGLHLNGTVAPWDDLRAGGMFEEWLSDFDKASEPGGDDD